MLEILLDQLLSLGGLAHPDQTSPPARGFSKAGKVKRA
jgi:hypothetical protein